MRFLAQALFLLILFFGLFANASRCEDIFRSDPEAEQSERYMFALHELLETTAGQQVLPADRQLLAEEGFQIGSRYLDSIGAKYTPELRSLEEGGPTFPVLVLEASQATKVGRFVALAEKRFPGLKVVFAPTYMIDGFSAAMLGPGELVVAMPALIVAPERGLGILLHELQHRKNNGRVGWLRSDGMKLPSLVTKLAGKLVEWQYPHHQSMDEPQAYAISFRIAFKKLREAIRVRDAEGVAGHWRELNGYARTISETLGRNIWAAETLLKRWERRQKLYDPLTENSVVAHSILTFETGASLIASWPLPGKPGDAGHDARLRQIYETNLVRDKTQLPHWIRMAEELAVIEATISAQKFDRLSGQKADRIWELFISRPPD